MMPLAARFVDGPDRAVYSGRLEPTFAAVLYGNAAVPQASSSPR